MALFWLHPSNYKNRKSYSWIIFQFTLKIHDETHSLCALAHAATYFSQEPISHLSCLLLPGSKVNNLIECSFWKSSFICLISCSLTHLCRSCLPLTPLGKKDILSKHAFTWPFNLQILPTWGLDVVSFSHTAKLFALIFLHLCFYTWPYFTLKHPFQVRTGWARCLHVHRDLSSFFTNCFSIV